MLQISPRSLDQRLRGEKRRRRLDGGTKPGTLLKHHLPLQTDDVQVPGFTEIDRVSQAGDSASGEFGYSLSVTDIHTGWTETPSPARQESGSGPSRSGSGRRGTALSLRGIDLDNSSEFINDHLRHCQAQGFNSRTVGLTRRTTTPTSSRRTGRPCGGCWATFAMTRRRRHFGRIPGSCARAGTVDRRTARTTTRDGNSGGLGDNR
jgi:hypothetical protein